MRLITSITDTGIGISAQNITTLFEMFRQIDTWAARNYEGTGLGLSICRRLVEMLGGEIWATSEGEQKGSTFTFTLPLARGQPMKPKVLVIEDNRAKPLLDNIPSETSWV